MRIGQAVEVNSTSNQLSMYSDIRSMERIHSFFFSLVLTPAHSDKKNKSRCEECCRHPQWPFPIAPSPSGRICPLH